MYSTVFTFVQPVFIQQCIGSVEIIYIDESFLFISDKILREYNFKDHILGELHIEKWLLWGKLYDFKVVDEL